MTKAVNKGKYITLNKASHSDSGLIKISYIHSNGDIWSNMDMDIWDCDKKITLDFSFAKVKDAKHRLKKIKNMRKALDQMEEYILEHKKHLKKLK